MGVINKNFFRSLHLLAMSSLVVGQNLLAFGLSAGKTKVKFLLNLYSQNSDHGRQIYDEANNNKEKVDVIEPMLFIEHQISKETQIKAHFVLDTWTAASDTSLDGLTGASGGGKTNQGRGSGNIGIVRDHKSWKWSSKVGIGAEYDYQTLNFGGHLETHHANDNFVFSVSPQLYLDKSKGFSLPEGKTLDAENRTIMSLGMAGTQILTPVDLLEVGYTFIHMNGALENISNSVFVADASLLPAEYSGLKFDRIEEKFPDSRVRHALHTKWVHGFNSTTALHASYRYYQDDWDLKTHTPELGLRMSLFDEAAFSMLTLRYYDQTQVKYWYGEKGINAPALPEFRTSDSDMEKFTAWKVGAHYSHNLSSRTWFGKEIEDLAVSGGVSYYKRSNGLHATTLQTGFSLSF